MTLNQKITGLIDWYKLQLSGKVRLFKGEENEMTTENIWAKLNHYTQIKNKDYMKNQWEDQINRAYYYNVECWPLGRIQERYERLERAELEAA